MSKLSSMGPRHWTSLFLSASGALVLGYVAYQYAEMYLAQDRLERKWNEQSRAGIQTKLDNASTDGLMRLSSPLMRLSSPNVALDAIVVQGDTTDALSQGPGHMENTPFPGERGNSVISGHRDTFFRHLGDLAPGDLLVVERNGVRYTYEVTGKKVVEPSDLSVIRPTSDAELTLITCHPIYYLGPAPKRLVVFSRLVQQPDSEKLRASDGTGKPTKGVLRKAAGTQ